MTDAPSAKLHILAPVVWDRKGEHRKLLKNALGDGFIRARVNGEVRSLEDDIRLARYEKHTIEIVIDRLRATPEKRGRMVEAIETGLAMADGLLTVLVEDEHRVFSASRSCPDHGVSIPEMEPRMFSFNAPQGA